MQPGAVAALARALEDADVGVVQARLRLLHQPELLNSSGNVVHVSGLAWPGGYRDPAEGSPTRRRSPTQAARPSRFDARSSASSAASPRSCFCTRKTSSSRWRAHLHGLRVLVLPDADVLHDYVLERPARQKEYYLERNRLIVVLSAFSGRLLLLLAPVLLAVEVGIVLVAWRQGWLREKARGWAWLVRNRAWLAAHRRETQTLRRVSDRELARFLTPVVDPRMLELPPGIAALNGLVSAWWRGVRVFL